MHSPIRQINFLLLWQAQAVSAVGSQLFNVALMYWLLETTGSATTMGLVMTASLIPVAFLSTFSGALVDQLPHKSTMICADVIRGLLCIGFVIALDATSTKKAILMLFVYVFLAGIASSLFTPALRASTPELVGRDGLERANSMLQSSRSLAAILGTSLGGFLYVWFGPGTLFVANGGSFLVSALALSIVRFPNQRRSQRGPLWPEVEAGFSYIFQQRGLRRIIATVACMNVTSAPLAISLPILVRDHYSAGPTLLGLLAASQSIGSIGGAMLLTRYRYPPTWRVRICATSLAVCAASLQGMIALTPGLPVCAAFAVYGLGIVCFNLPTQTAIQLNTPVNLRGRVISTSTTLVAGIMPVAAAATGFVLDAIHKNLVMVWAMTAIVFLGCALSLVTSAAARSYLQVE